MRGWVRAAAVSTLLSASAFAQEPHEKAAAPERPAGAIEWEQISLVELMQQPVPTGSFVGAAAFESPMSVTVITREQVVASGARHLSELLEIYVPGFQYMVNKWNGLIWGMRGVAADRNSKFIFLVNGQQLNLEASHGAFSEITLGLLDDVEKVEVLRGPAGMVYGSGSIAGVVNVITRSADQTGARARLGIGTEGNPQFETDTTIRYGEKQSFALSFGARRSAGHGDRSGRVYGNHEWPTPGAPGEGSYPVDGSPWQTPGNFRVSADLRHGNLRLYTRFTRQQFPTGQFFVVDPWPDYGDPVPNDAPIREIDGREVAPGDPLSMTESFGFNRRLHLVDNLASQVTWTLDLGENELTTRLAFAATTDALRTQARDGYGVVGEDPVAGKLGYTFGDRRFTSGLKYVLRQFDGLTAALGTEYRVDDIGRDLNGRNSFGGSDERFFVSDVVYGNFAAYSEAVFDVYEWLSMEGGLRVDKHTRTPWIANPRLSALFFPAPGHTVKAIFQTASNNGQADFYELDWASVTDQGQVRTEPYLEVPSDPSSAIIRPSRLEDRHALKPERAISAELNSMHFISDSVSIAPSISLTRINNLFTWNPDFFSTVNAGYYTFVEAAFESHYRPSPDFHLGLSHSYSRVIDAEDDPTTFTRNGVQVVENGDGSFSVVEDSDTEESVDVNPVVSQISEDGRNFLNLSSNISKAFVTYSPLDWWTLHSSARVFWGLPGRKNLYADDVATGYDYLGVENGAPIVKWHLASHFRYRDSSLGLYAYDLLGHAKSRHAFRHQQSAASVQRGLYTVDQRAFFVSYSHDFH